jgi:hypothetical protein
VRDREKTTPPGCRCAKKTKTTPPGCRCAKKKNNAARLLKRKEKKDKGCRTHTAGAAAPLSRSIFSSFRKPSHTAIFEEQSRARYMPAMSKMVSTTFVEPWIGHCFFFFYSLQILHSYGASMVVRRISPMIKSSTSESRQQNLSCIPHESTVGSKAAIQLSTYEA